MARVRLDSLLAERGLFPSRTRAAAAVLAGEVHLGPGRRRAEKPGQLVAADVELDVALPPRYVSRGGIKLASALDALGVDVAGRHALDVGASTGGFTDCLLQRGAQRVYALDVGSRQLAPRLRIHPRVIPLEGRNIRMFQATDLPEAVDLITVDLSFISLRLVLPRLPPFLRPYGRVMALVKPQFEVGAKHVGRGGIVRHPHQREVALHSVIQVAVEAGFRIIQTTKASGSRPSGNQEVFLDLDRAAEDAVVAAMSSPIDVRNTSPRNGGGERMICSPS
jgi:23S rRNA (cytidine1920-2'-O)/16S rRNA (cytidine1409-2'-O)-methyltransferase